MFEKDCEFPLVYEYFDTLPISKSTFFHHNKDTIGRERIELPQHLNNEYTENLCLIYVWTDNALFWYLKNQDHKTSCLHEIKLYKFIV